MAKGPCRLKIMVFEDGVEEPWTMNSNQLGRGYASGLLAALLYGTTATLGKYALSYTDPLSVAVFGYLIGALIFLPTRSHGNIERRTLGLVVLAGLFGSTIAPLLYFTGLSMTSATNAALLSNGEAIFTTILAVALFGEILNRYQVMAGAVVLFGIGLVSAAPGERLGDLVATLQGNLLVVCATAVWGIDNNISRVASQLIDPTILTKYKNAVGAACLLIITFATGSLHIPLASQIPALVGVGVLGVGLSTALLMHTLRRLGAVRAVMLFSTASLFGLVFAHVFLGEPITVIQLGGAALMLTGLYFLNRKAKTENV